MARIRAPYILLAIVIVLIGIRAYLPTAIQLYANRTLDRIPDYDGRIGDVDLQLFRGAYALDGVELIKTTGKVPVPVFKADRVDFSVEWQALLDGKLVGEIVADHAILNFVGGPTDAQAQTQVDGVWLQAVKDLFPLRINRFELKNSEIHYRDFHSDPKVDVYVNAVHLLGTDFSNTTEPDESLEATIQVTGLAQAHAPLSATVKLDPSKSAPTFTLDGSLTKLELTALNDLLRAYGGFDAEGGTFELYTEIQAKDDRIKGYLKPFFKDVEIVEVSTDSDNPLQLLWEGVVGATMKLFKNQDKDHVATKVPFEGAIGDAKSDVWTTILGILKNAFVQALQPGVEKKLDLKDIDGEAQRAGFGAPDR